MKKLFMIATLIAVTTGLSVTSALAETATNTTTTTTTATAATNWDSAASLKKVNAIGTKILIANHLPQNITFKVSDQEDINAYSNIDKEIYVYRGLLQYVTTDEELAAVIAHEMGHIINSHCAKQTLINTAVTSLAPTLQNQKAEATLQTAQELSLMKLSRSEEFEADITGVDLMLQSGYNPLAMISVLNKICGNYIDVFETHPSGEKRILNIYDYLNYNYPAKIKTGYKTDSYQKALSYITLTVQERQTNPKKMAKYKKAQEKLKKDKIKRAKKMRSSTNPWDTSYTILKLLSTPASS